MMPDNQFRQRPIAPWYLWVVGVLAILWNGLGVFLWAGTSFLPDTFLKDLPVAHQEYVRGLPGWSTVTWGLGVLGGTMGSILLLLRNSLAVPAFALSLAGAVVNTLVYVTNPPPEGFFNLPLTMFIIAIAVLLFWFARLMKLCGVI